MIEPSIEELTKEIQKKCDIDINRYELVIATAKAARIITDIINEKREEMEKNAAAKESGGNPEKPPPPKDIKDIPNEKMVKSAIQKIYDGEFMIVTEVY